MDGKRGSVRTRYAAAALLALCLYAVPAQGQTRPRVPVQVGGEGGSEGCWGSATVAVRSGSTLNLRSGPGTNHLIIGRLLPGQHVSVCQRANRGWVGIVVHRGDGGPSDCGLSDAGEEPKPYTGPCAAGWVSEAFLRLFAG